MEILTYWLKNIFVTYCFKPLTVRVLFLLPAKKVSLQVVNSPCFSSTYYVPGDELSTLLTCDQSFKGDPAINLLLQKKKQIPSQEAGWCQDSNAAFWVHIQDSSPLNTDSAVKPAVQVSWPAASPTVVISVSTSCVLKLYLGLLCLLGELTLWYYVMYFSISDTFPFPKVYFDVSISTHIPFD